MNAELQTKDNPDPKSKPADEIETADLEAYRKFVADRAEKADGELFFNRSAAHAAIVVEFLFGGAAKEMNILTGELYEPVYGVPAVVGAAVAFLCNHPQAIIRIASERPISDSHPMLKGLADAGLRDRVTVKLLNPLAVATMSCHFAVADGRSFRFEPNKKLMEAAIQFGAPDLGARLNGLFYTTIKS